MSKMNLLVHINMYEDAKSTNSPSLNHVKWNRDIQGISVNQPESKSVMLPSGQSLSLFAGTVSVSSDATTTYDIALKSGSASTYRITHSGGTNPVFRSSRASGADATTEVTVTKNAKLVKFESTGGTLFSLIAGGAVVGDEVRIGDGFNLSNRGKFKILALDAVSFTIENELGSAEGPIVLGATFSDQINIFGTNGVQIGDKVDIIAGFSSVSFGTYEITDVSHDYIEFYSINSLPSETNVSNNPSALLIYRDAKQFIYVETNKKIELKINNSTVANEISPFNVGVAVKPGIFMSQASIKSAEITNKSQETAEVFFITAE